MAGGGIFDDIAGPAPQQPAQQYEPQSAATPAQQAYIAQNGMGSTDPSIAVGSPQRPTFDTATLKGSPDATTVTTDGVLQTPGVDAEHNIFSDLAARRKDDLLGFEQMALKPLDNAASWLENGLGAIGLPVGAIDKALGTPSADVVKQAHLDYIKQQAAVGVDPGIAGQVAGGVVGTLPLAMLPGGALTQGALGGAALSDAKDVKGIALDAGIGAVGGKLGEAVLNGVRGVISPAIGEAQKYLMQQGVRLTPGQMAGGPLRAAEDVIAGVPIAGSLAQTGQRNAVLDFNRSIANQALEPIGKTVPSDVSPGYEAVGHVQKTLSDAYKGLLPKLNVATPSPPPGAVALAGAPSTGGQFIGNVDPQFVGGMTDIVQKAVDTFPDADTNQLKTIIQQHVLRQLNANPTGETMKAVDSSLGDIASNTQSNFLRGAVRDVQTQLRGTVLRANPEYKADLNGINAGWARYKRLEDAAGSSGSTGGVVTPAKYHASVVKMASDTDAASGQGLMQKFSSAAKEVLPNTIPDSGSAGRAAALLATSAFLGHGVHINPLEMGAAGLASLPYFGVGKDAARIALTQRPAAAKAFADYLTRFQAPAAAAGAAGAVQTSKAYSQ